MEQFNTIGRLTRDLELKNTDNGGGFYTGSIAVNKTKDKAVFHNIILDKKYGEKIAQYLLKGTQVFVTGVPNVNMWKDPKTQETKANITISVKTITMLGSKSDAAPEKELPALAPSIQSDVPF